MNNCEPADLELGNDWQRGAAQRSAGVITASDRCAAGLASDTSGPLAANLLREAGWQVAPVLISSDDPQALYTALTQALAQHRLVVVTGGTGLGPRDNTPQVIADVADFEIPGIGELMRASFRKTIPVTDLSRAGGWRVGDRLVIALPGSEGGVRDGLAAICPILDHAVNIAAGTTSAHPIQHQHQQPGSPTRAVDQNQQHNHQDRNHPLHPSERQHRQQDQCGSLTQHQQGPSTPVTDADADSHATGQYKAPMEGKTSPNHVAGADVAGQVITAEVTDQPISSEALAAQCHNHEVGAIVTFDGQVRNHDHHRVVTALEYEAHPSARKVLVKIAATAAAQPGVISVAVAHRVGALDIGEIAFSVVVCSAHRQAAFQTCSWLVDEVKDQLPVWKLQRFADGTEEWVNCA